MHPHTITMYGKGLAYMLPHKAVERLQAWEIISFWISPKIDILNTAKVARNKQTSKENININKILTFIVEADSDIFCTFAAVGIQWGGSRWQDLFAIGRLAGFPFHYCNNGFLWLYPLGGG